MRTIVRVAVAALLALAAAGCGGDDGDSAGESDDTTTTDDGGTDGGTDGDIAAGLVADDCQFLLAGAFLNPLAAAVPGADADFDETSAQLEAIADAAPDEIQDAMATVADRFGEFAEVLQDVDLQDPQAFADPEVQAALEDLEAIFDDEYEAAGQAITDYVEENCSG